MIVIITAFLLWCVYCVLEGRREAYYYNSLWKGLSSIYIIPANLHPLFTIQRSIILGVICLINFDWWLISLPLVFSFFHNGMYYLTRHELNYRIYPKGWWDMSTTSTAFTTKLFTPVIRTTLFIVGIGVLVTYLI